MNYRYRLKSLWWSFRHDVYYYEVPVLPPVQLHGDGITDNAPIIQYAINQAAQEPEWFTVIYAAYQRKWYRFFLKKPVLKASVRFQAGIYTVGKPLVLGDNMTLIGQGHEHTSIKKESSK